MAAYYNEHDKFAAQWLRNLIAAGHIADGEVDERDIKDVVPDELHEFTQCHFFAGIGVWSYALRRAGWPDDRPVWTGSCPCQPFSTAGRGEGFADERHLWPHWFHIIGQCRPGVVFGEQVADRDGLAWLDLVQADMEGKNYAIGSLDLCVAGFGAPGKRQRSFWVANTNTDRCYTPSLDRGDNEKYHLEPCGQSGVMDNAIGNGRRERRDDHPGHERFQSDATIKAGSMANTDSQRLQRQRSDSDSQGRQGPDVSASGLCNRAGPVNGFWANAEWLLHTDGKYRPIEPGTFPLAHGATKRVGRLRGYGNAINAEVATEFIKSYLDIIDNRDHVHG